MSDVSSETGAEASAQVDRRKVDSHLLALSGIALASIAASLWNIRQENVWYDEIATVKFLNEPSLGQFMEAMQKHNPPVQPLYPIFEYYWYHLFGESILSLRLSSLAMIAPLLVVIYLLGRRLANPTAGLVAAGIIAFSPVTLYYSQEVRMYSLILLLSGFSVYSVVMLAETRKPVWWFFSGLCTVLIVWTHILGVFFLVCQFCYVSVRFGLSGWRSVFLWSALQVAAVATILPWLLSADYDYIREQYEFRTHPAFFYEYFVERRKSVQGLFADWIGLGALPNAIPMGRWILSGINLTLYALFGVSASYLLYRFYRLLRDRETARVANLVLILSLTTLPVVMLYLLSILWEPSFFPRYVLVSFVGLALIPAVAVGEISGRRMRAIAGLAVVLLVAAQSAFYLQIPSRRHWSSVAEIVERQREERVDVYLYGSDPHLLLTEAQYHLTSDRVARFVTYNQLNKLDGNLVRIHSMNPFNSAKKSDVLVVIESDKAVAVANLLDKKRVRYKKHTIRSRGTVVCFEFPKS